MFRKHSYLALLLCSLNFIEPHSSFSIKKSLRFLQKMIVIGSFAPTIAYANENAKYLKSHTGIEYYDYRVGDGPDVKNGDKVIFNYKGRLAGRQGWIYDDTYAAEPVRIILGATPAIEGIEIGFIGDDKIMPAMKVGGKRRLVIPSRLGYKNKEQLPIPRDFGSRQRLYSTVLNDIRESREAEALGDSLVGRLVLDVDLIRVEKINK